VYHALLDARTGVTYAAANHTTYGPTVQYSSDEGRTWKRSRPLILQEGFVGGSMGDESVILEGVASPDADQSLHSTVHGAGRVMSRTKAAGRVRRRKRWACTHRDCDRVFDIDGISSTAGVPKSGVCPDHPTSRVRKVWVEEQISPGVVDWPAVQARLRAQGVVLVGGGADEAPEVYKRLPEVLAAHGDTIRVKHTLRPLGVAMAGRDVHDPYKD
jgi:tRNA-splicing ligase RtcB